MFEERVEKEERFVFTSLSLYSPDGFKKGRSRHPAIRGFTWGDIIVICVGSQGPGAREAWLSLL